VAEARLEITDLRTRVLMPLAKVYRSECAALTPSRLKEICRMALTGRVCPAVPLSARMICTGASALAVVSAQLNMYRPGFTGSTSTITASPIRYIGV